MTKKEKKKTQDNRLPSLMEHYTTGRHTTDTRRQRKGGWNDIVNAYMNKLPQNWPYSSVVVDPRIRTSILEKTSRLINSKLKGKIVPRNGGTTIGAKVNNYILDIQWDAAKKGGTMMEKVSDADRVARIAGAAFSYQYWDDARGGPECKILDPNNIWFSYNATHKGNARWAQVREFVTIDDLNARFENVPNLKGEPSGVRQNLYLDQVLQNRELEDNLGKDPTNPVVEVITEWTPGWATKDGKGREQVFLPKHGHVLEDRELPWSHKELPLAQLRYYPLGSDIYGESEVEPVLSLWKAIQAILCGFIDEMNISMRPPLKVITGQVRRHTIEYGPGALWLMNNPNAVTEASIGANAIRNFQNTYPALVAAFNTAMGDSSLGISNLPPFQNEKTATEVQALTTQQTTRDQHNQLFLGEFLKDIMMQWLSMNQQFLFKKNGQPKMFQVDQQDYITEMSELGLGDEELPDAAVQEIADIIQEAPNPRAITDQLLEEVTRDIRIPKHGVKTGKKIVPKFQKKSRNEGELLVEPKDMEGMYEYHPDIKSMMKGKREEAEQARRTAFELSLNPAVVQMLEKQGTTVDLRELLVMILSDAGLPEVERIFTDAARTERPETSVGGVGDVGAQGMGPTPEALPMDAGAGGLPQPQGL